MPSAFPIYMSYFNAMLRSFNAASMIQSKVIGQLSGPFLISAFLTAKIRHAFVASIHSSVEPNSFSKAGRSSLNL